jgi:hypothetical protein
VTKTKSAIVVLSDPDGGEEALGRTFNALAAAKDFREQGAEVRLLFQGAGTRWTGLLGEDGHPLHELYAAVRRDVAGASDACATFFGARDRVSAAGLQFVAQNHIEGVGGLPSLAALVRDGFTVLTF